MNVTTRVIDAKMGEKKIISKDICSIKQLTIHVHAHYVIMYECTHSKVYY